MSSEIMHIAPVAIGAYRAGENVSGVATGTEAPGGRATEDIVEFSDLSRSLAAEQASSSFRRARVEAIRREIAEGRFETPERLSGTVNRLLDLLV